MACYLEFFVLYLPAVIVFAFFVMAITWIWSSGTARCFWILFRFHSLLVRTEARSLNLGLSSLLHCKKIFGRYWFVYQCTVLTNFRIMNSKSAPKVYECFLKGSNLASASYWPVFCMHTSDMLDWYFIATNIAYGSSLPTLTFKQWLTPRKLTCNQGIMLFSASVTTYCSSL